MSDKRAESAGPDRPIASSAEPLTEVLRAARAGSKEALGELFDAFRNYLLAAANQAVAADIRQKVAPSDLVQQTMIDACRGFDRFEGTSEAELHAWLRRILLHNVGDVVQGFRKTAKRDIAREVPLECDESAQEIYQRVATQEPSPSSCAVAVEERILLEQALARMPRHYADAVRMRNLEYCSFAEMGAAMQTTADTARKLWERAIKRLARELRPSHDSARTF